MRLIHPTDVSPAIPPRERRERTPARLVRCACPVCGTHSNALQTFRITGSCTNCGSFDLVPVDGAEPLGGPLAA